MDWAHSNQSTVPRQTLISIHLQSVTNEDLRTGYDFDMQTLLLGKG
jgi:hypothetical protein